jgi:inorganic pyrophosphatase
MSHPFHSIPPLAVTGPPEEPHGLHMVVETPQGSRNKFNLNEEFGVFQFSRTLRAGMAWPCDFGFVPQTLAGDGDPLDVALISEAPMFPGVLVRVRILGAIGLVKNGEENNRLIAVPARSRKAPSIYDDVHDLSDLLPRQIRSIEAFLSDYNTFEGHVIDLTGWMNAERAWQLVHEAILRGKTGT